MKSRKAKITVIICMMLLLTGVFAVLRSGTSTDVTETAEENSKRIQTISEDEISEYTTKTVIVKAKGDISSKSALEEKREGDLYIFTYKTEEDAKEAHEAFQKDENIEYADSNAVIAAMEAHEHEEVQAPEGFPEPDESVIKDIDKNIEVTKKDTVEGINRYIKESSNEVVVAVLDSGINTEDERVLPGINVTGETVMEDDTGHGTKIADIILSNTGKNVKVLPVKVLNNNRGTMLNLYRGIKEAIERDVDVINISVNGIKTKESGMITEAIEEATNKGIVVVASAGNDSIDAKYTTPANVESAITVSAVQDSYAFARGYSNFGDVVDYSALGYYATVEDGKPVQYAGTSFSAAYLTSAVSGIKAMNKEYNTEKVQDILNKYAIDLGNTGKDELYGYGFISLEDIDKLLIENSNYSVQATEQDYSLRMIDQPATIFAYKDTWKQLDTESLDEILRKTNQKYVFMFMNSLSENDFKYLISKSECLNQETTYTKAIDFVSENDMPSPKRMKYYEYLQEEYSGISASYVVGGNGYNEALWGNMGSRVYFYLCDKTLGDKTLYQIDINAAHPLQEHTQQQDGFISSVAIKTVYKELGNVDVSSTYRSTVAAAYPALGVDGADGYGIIKLVVEFSLPSNYYMVDSHTTTCANASADFSNVVTNGRMEKCSNCCAFNTNAWCAVAANDVLGPVVADGQEICTSEGEFKIVNYPTLQRFHIQVNTCEANFRSCDACISSNNNTLGTTQNGRLDRYTTGPYNQLVEDNIPWVSKDINIALGRYKVNVWLHNNVWPLGVYGTEFNPNYASASISEFVSGNTGAYFSHASGRGVEASVKAGGHWDANVNLNTGYKLNFWNAEADSVMGAGFGTNQGNKTTIKLGPTYQTMTIGANVSPILYNIEYEYNGGLAPAGVTHPYCAYYDQPFTVERPTRTGYIFRGWTITGMNTNTTMASKDNSTWDRLITNGNMYSREYLYFKNMSTTDDDTVTFTANWEEIKYDIKFDLNKGTGSTTPKWKDNPSPDNIKVKPTEYVNIPNPTRDGYTFTGWKITGMDENTHYYAEGSNAYNADWDDSTTTSTDKKKTYFKQLRKSSGVVTFTAQWKANEYTLTIDPNGGCLAGKENGTYSTTTRTRKVAFDSSLFFVTTAEAYSTSDNGYLCIEATKEGTTYVAYKEGYNFTGWSLSSDAYPSLISSKTVGDHKDYTYTCKYASDNTVTAQWSPQILTINLDDQGGSGSSPNPIYEKYGVGYYSNSGCTTSITKITTKPQRTGYTFGGYYTSKNGVGTQVIDKDGKIVAENTQFYKAQDSSNTTFTVYAKWTPIKYNIEFNLNKGSGSTDPYLNVGGTDTTTPATRTVEFNSYTNIPNPTRVGYTFTGWKITNMTSSTHYFATSASDSDAKTHAYNTATHTETYFKNLRNTSGTVTFTAQWTPITYDIEFNLNKGSGSTDPYLNVGGTDTTTPAKRTVKFDNYTNIPNPTRAGYTFTGWKITNMTSSTHYFATSASDSDAKTHAYNTATHTETYFKNLRNTSGTVTFTAQWTPNKYTLTIDPDGGKLYGFINGVNTSSTEPQKRTVTFDSAYHFVTTNYAVGNGDNLYFMFDRTLEDNTYKPYKRGYNFTSWKVLHETSPSQIRINSMKDGDNQNYSDFDYLSTYAGDNTVTAQWSPQILTINLDDQKPSYDVGWKDSSPKTIYAKYGIGYFKNVTCTTSITSITKPERTGYTFGGYYTSTNGSGTQVIDANGNITSNATIFAKERNSTNTTFTIYAKWTAIKYDVVYYNEESTGQNDTNRTNTATKNNSKYNDSTNRKTFDTAFNLQSNKFTRFYDVSYDYNGGNTGISSNRATYTFRGWEDRNDYKYHGVTYKWNTGVGDNRFNAPFYANTNTDVKNAYGYNKLALLQHYLSNGKAEGRKAVSENPNQGYPNSANVNNLATEDMEVKLYALWNDGSVTLPTPTRAKSADGYEYEFLGWFDVKYADDEMDDDYSHLIGKAGDRIVPTQDMQLYASWKLVRPGDGGEEHPIPLEGQPGTKISIKADWVDKSTDNRNTDYDIYKGKTISDKDKVNVNGIAKVTVTANITNETYTAKDWKGNSVSFTAKAVTNEITETIDTTKWDYITSTPVSVSNGKVEYSNGVFVWKPVDNTTGTITMTYYVKLKESYWDVAEKTLYDIESKDTTWTYKIGGDNVNILFGEKRTNIHSPVNVQMRPVDWNPNDTAPQPTPTQTPKPGATPGPDLPSDPDPTPAPDNGGFVSRISIRSDNSNTKGSAWNFYKKKNEVNTYYVKYNTKASEPKSQFKLAFYGVLKRARVGYQINNMYFDSHYSKDGKAQTYDYFTDNLEKIGQKYAWSSSVLTHADWYYAEDGTPHAGTKSKVLDFVHVTNTRSNDTSGIAVNASDPRTKLSSEQTNTVTNGDNGARIDVYPQVKINGDNTYYNTNRYVLSDTDVISKRISLVVDAKDPVLTYKAKDETNFYDEDSENGEDIGEGNYIDINLTDSYKTEGTKELVFNFGDDVSGVSDPDRYTDDWITNSNQNVQVRLERLGYKEDGTIVTNEEYKVMSSAEKAKVSNDPIVIYDNKNNVTNNTVEISYNSDGTGGSFKVNLDKNNDNILGHLRMTVRIIDNVGNYYDKIYDFYVLKLTGKVEISKYLPRYSKAAANNTLNEFKKGESGNVSISAKGYVDRITTDFGTNMVNWTEEEAKLHNIFASDNYHINGDYPRDYDNTKATLPAKYHKLAWGYINSELGGLPVKLSSQYTKKITVTKDIVNNNIDVLKAGNVVTVPAQYESGSLVQDSYTIAFSTEKNSADLPKYIIVNGKDKAKLTWKDDRVSFDEIVTTSTDWVTVGGEKLRPMVHAFYIPFSADTGDYKVLVTAYKDGHKVRINIPYKVDGNILSDIRTRIRDN